MMELSMAQSRHCPTVGMGPVQADGWGQRESCKTEHPGRPLGAGFLTVWR